MSVELESTNQQLRSKEICRAIGVLDLPSDMLTVPFADAEKTLDSFRSAYDFEMKPNFQRERVWTQEQKIHYIENYIRGAVGVLGRTIAFNNPAFRVQPTDYKMPPDAELKMVCLDGMQRLSAVIEFMRGEFRVFRNIYPASDGVDVDFFDGTACSPKLIQNGLFFQICSMQYNWDIYNYYITFNSGGTAHTTDEINRVIALRDSVAMPY